MYPFLTWTASPVSKSSFLGVFPDIALPAVFIPPMVTWRGSFSPSRNYIKEQPGFRIRKSLMSVIYPPAILSGARGCLGQGRLGVFLGQVWEFRFWPSFPSFLGKIAVREMSGKTPASPRHPSSRHPWPSDSGAGNGCASFMGAWDFLVLSAGKPPMPIKFLFFGGGVIMDFLGRRGVEGTSFYFYGRGDFSDRRKNADKQAHA